MYQYHLTTLAANLSPVLLAATLKDSPMPQAPIEVGQVAPDFELDASVGESPLRLSSLRKRFVVLGFYVLDFTST